MGTKTAGTKPRKEKNVIIALRDRIVSDTCKPYSQVQEDLIRRLIQGGINLAFVTPESIEALQVQIVALLEEVDMQDLWEIHIHQVNSFSFNLTRVARMERS